MPSGEGEREASWSGGRQPARSRTRDGRNAIERQAITLVRHETAAMPASLVVQLAFWPDEIAAWARSEGTSESLVYNMLARRKPYVRMRGRLAERLEVPLAVLSHLIDARRPLPSMKRDLTAVTSPSAEPPPIDWSRPPFPPVRDGTSPIERRAVRAVETDVATMPASAVVGLALWPETLAGWSREQNLKASVVWATLAGAQSERVRSTLARRLGVSARDLDDLIAGARATPAGARLFVDRPADDDARPARTGAVGADIRDSLDTRVDKPSDRRVARRPADAESAVKGSVDNGQMELDI